MTDTAHTCPPDHAHAAADTLTCYFAHRCRCAPCSDLAAAYDSWRNHQLKQGRPLIIPALGTRRRLQALMCLGWSLPAIAAHLNDTGTNINRLLHADHITRRFADRIAAVYDHLSMTVPTSDTRTGRAALAKTRNFARRHGWQPPLYWDDIDTDPDEPTITPDGDAETAPELPQATVDEIAVEIALTGRPVHLTPAERRVCVTRLHAKKYSDDAIADRIRCNPKTVERIRAELHLPGWACTELQVMKAAA